MMMSNFLSAAALSLSIFSPLSTAAVGLVAFNAVATAVAFLAPTSSDLRRCLVTFPISNLPESKTHKSVAPPLTRQSATRLPREPTPMIAIRESASSSHNPPLE